MKYLFYSSYFYPYISGLTVYPLKILESIKRGNEITVLTFLFSKKIPPEETVFGLRVRRISYFFRISKGFISPQSIAIFIQEVLKTDTIILNIPNFEALPLAVFGKLTGKKIICIFGCEVYLGDDVKSKLLVTALNISVFLQLRLSDLIVAFPDYIESLRIYNLFKKKIVTCLPIIAKKETDMRSINQYLNLKKNEIWVGFAGRLAKEKGVEYLLDACELLIQHFPNLRICLAGPMEGETIGEESYHAFIMEKLKKSGLKYRLFGRLKDVDLGAFYKVIDVLVLPSINKTEAFGMVQVESMLSGTPVVASDMPGVRLPVKLTGMGELFIPRNVEDLAKKIQSVLKKRTLYIKRKTKAEEVFNNKKIQKKYMRIFNQREIF